MRIHTGIRNLKCSFIILPLHDIPYYIRYKQQQQKQIFNIGKNHCIYYLTIYNLRLKLPLILQLSKITV